MKARVALPPVRELGVAMVAFCESFMKGEGTSSVSPKRRTPLSLDTKPVQDVHEHVLKCVQEVDPGTGLYVFGSTAVYGLYHPSSDVDLVALHTSDVVDGTGEDASTEIAKGVQSDFLSRLALAIARKQPLWQVELVRRTRVPVLRVASGSGVPFDVTAFRRNGVRNSELLRSYVSQNVHARWLSIVMKRWSKLAGVNTAVEGGCITSYGFNVMLAYYLLRMELVKFVPPESCDVAHIASTPTYFPLEVPNDTDGRELAQMALDLLQFYRYDFDWENHVVSLCKPRLITKEELQWTKHTEDMKLIRGEKVHYRWCIEDPYEVNLNVGRNVTPFKEMLLRKHLERAIQTGFLCLPPSCIGGK